MVNKTYIVNAVRKAKSVQDLYAVVADCRSQGISDDLTMYLNKAIAERKAYIVGRSKGFTRVAIIPLNIDTNRELTLYLDIDPGTNGNQIYVNDDLSVRFS